MIPDKYGRLVYKGPCQVHGQTLEQGETLLLWTNERRAELHKETEGIEFYAIRCWDDPQEDAKHDFMEYLIQGLVAELRTDVENFLRELNRKRQCPKKPSNA